MAHSLISRGSRIVVVDAVIVAYTEMPSIAGGTPRPLLDIVVSGMADAPVPCLVDSGAVNTLLPQWIVEAAGIDLMGTPKRSLAIAGAETSAHFMTVMLTVEHVTREAPVGFCAPWPHGCGLLGHDAFFRYFVATFRAADFEFELAPVGK